ncbi:MAG: hypothetical protein IM620_19720 [Cytophagales bacterium]|nr:hypothetical protein [Cytophagales bacterium]
MSYDPTDNPSFVRENNSGALINKNIDELRVLKAQRDKMLFQQNELKDLKNQLEQIKALLAKGGINV